MFKNMERGSAVVSVLASGARDPGFDPQQGWEIVMGISSGSEYAPLA